MVFHAAGLSPEPYRSLDAFGAFLPVSSILQADPADAVPVPMLAMARYCREFLTRPNPAIGRSGPVCPFTARAIALRRLLVTACRLDTPDAEALTGALAALRAAFLAAEAALPEDERLFHAVVVTFPGLPEEAAPALIEQVQRRLKADYVASGLMIGEFYPDCPAPGLHNPDFRPLRSPVPAIAIRHLTLQDAPFMLGDARVRTSYEQRFGDAGVRQITALLDSRAGCPVAQVGQASPQDA